VLFHLRLTLAHRQALYVEGDAFSSIYAVCSGSLKAQIDTEEGREQLIAMHMPGEFFGGEGLAAGRRTRTVVALQDCEVCVLPFAALDRLMAENSAAHRWFLRTISAELARSAAAVARLRGATAEERIAGLLVDLAQRLAASGRPAADLTLGVTRGDIALHLGLTRETVSRILARLHREHLLDGDAHRLHIADRAALARLAGGAAHTGTTSAYA